MARDAAVHKTLPPLGLRFPGTDSRFTPICDE